MVRSMGGFGSGRRGGLATVEGCSSLVLDIDHITRPLRQAKRTQIAPGDRTESYISGIYRWTRAGESSPFAKVDYHLTLRAEDGMAGLRYDVDHVSRPTGPQVQWISLATTSCNYGGVRWYWICPATGRMVRKLYLPNGGLKFLSRGLGAYQLAYASERMTRLDTAHARSRRLYRRLGAEYYGPVDGFWPPRPPRMRWWTYDAICERLADEERQLNQGLMRAGAYAGWATGL